MQFWKRIYGLARPFRATLVLSLVVTVAAQFVGFLPMLAQKRLFDLAEERYRGDSISSGDFAAAVVAIMLAAMLSEIGAQFVWYLSDRLQARMSQRLTTDTSEHLLRLSLGFHTRHDTAKKLSIVGTGLDKSHRIIWTVLVNMMPVCCMWVVYLGWTLTIALVPALVMAAGSVALVALAARMQRPIRPLQEALEQAGHAVTTYQHDVIAKIQTVKAAAAESFVLGQIVKRGEELTELSMKLAWKTMRINSALSVVRQVSSGIVLGISLWQFLRGDVTLGTLTLLFGVSQRLVMSAQMALQYYGQVESYRPAAESLFKLLDERSDVPPPANPIPLGRVLGSIAFENVSFAHLDTVGTIHDATFFVPAGKTVAIVGPSGAGKSTLATLILRGFDPDAGRVLVDGKDLRDLDPSEYLRQVGIVAQGVGIFNTSIRENIAFGIENANQEHVEEAARMAGAHEFIVTLKDGYDTAAGENGVKLSGGQAQRIAIARALLRDPRLLILDEATSHLDVETEARVMEEIVTRIKGTRTVVVIAHRLSTIRSADEIVVVDQGRVVQRGTYDVLRNAPGVFRRLVELQADGALP